MPKDIVIRANNISKIYHLYENPIDRLKEVLHPLRKKYHHDFAALKGISIEIERGETVGIIGKNGSGKSTLLKILTGVLTPTSGEFQVNGKVAALLELGAGFNTELTGLENVYLNGSLMGYSQQEMDEKKDAILDFADIGEFIYQPVRMYSSGMFARLAFAVAINVEPDILIVDEALSVGDVFFQAKCYNYFKQLKQKGTTILFVTHSLDVVLRTCSSAFCLANGSIVASGPTDAVVDAYKKHETFSKYSDISNKNELSLFQSAYTINQRTDEYGTKEVTIDDFAILDADENPQSTFYQGQMAAIYMKFSTHKKISNLICAFAIKTVDGIEVLGSNSSIMNLDLSDKLRPGSGAIYFRFPLMLQSNNYTLSLGLTYFDTKGHLQVYHRLYNIIGFTVGNIHGGTGIYAPKIEVQLN
ncbi:MAG: teichoic acid ABC transporter ATP-binding protein [Oligoflexia bacterium]|nr:MAG: teichoic acid ABC transporter ATP-binding protein [Oligoflexia bacterium]